MMTLMSDIFVYVVLDFSFHREKIQQRQYCIKRYIAQE